MLSLGLYQSYICVSIVLILFVCIMELLDGEKAKSVICKGLRACAMLLLGGIIYYVLMKLVVRLSGIQMLGIGVVGQYLAKTYLETKHRPIYLTRLTNIEKKAKKEEA